MRVLIPPQGTRQITQILLNTPQNQSQTNLSLVRLSSTSSSQHASCEDQLRRKMLEKIIRVDHAGEMWASFIYQGNYSAIREFCLRSLFLKACDLYFHSFSFRSNGSFKEYKVARPHPGDVGSWKGTSCKVWGTVGGIPGQLQELKNNFVTEMEMPNILSCSRRYDQQCWSQFGSLRGSPWGRVALCWEKRGQWPAQLRWVAIYFLH